LKGAISGEAAEVLALSELTLAYAAITVRVEERARQATGLLAAIEHGEIARTTAIFRGQTAIAQHPWVPLTTAGRAALIKQLLVWRPGAGPQIDMYLHPRNELRAAVDQRIAMLLTAWEFDGTEPEERVRVAALVEAAQQATAGIPNAAAAARPGGTPAAGSASNGVEATHVGAGTPPKVNAAGCGCLVLLLLVCAGALGGGTKRSTGVIQRADTRAPIFYVRMRTQGQSLLSLVSACTGAPRTLTSIV
jgi:hypothetical protein